MRTRFILIVFIHLTMIIVNDGASSTLLKMLRKHKTIGLQTRSSSPAQLNINEGSKLRLTCSFLSNFDKIDIFWFHNGTLIQSFISPKIVEDEDDDVESSFLAVTIVSTLQIDKTHLDINGLFQCVAVHNQIRSQKTFTIRVTANKKDSIKTNFSKDALITVHTSQALFEPRRSIALMCRFGDNRKDQCTTQWSNPENEPLNSLSEETNLVLVKPSFENHMGLYICRNCCHNQCQILTSFVYPAGQKK